jgi:UDP-N-acetylmuramate dehydrogenase
MKDIQHYSLLSHNTFGIDAKCSRFVEFSTDDEARLVAAMLRQECAEGFLIIGGGSNLLLTADYPGMVVHSAIRGMEQVERGTTDITDFTEREKSGERKVERGKSDDGEVLVRCGSGEVWDDVVAWCVAQGWYGAENLSLIPGEVGASAVQNIGAYGAEAKDIIYKVEAVEIATGNRCEISCADCGYGYRQSRFKHEWRNRYLITHVTYRLSTTFVPRLDYGNIRQELLRRGISEPTAEDVRQTIIDIRNAKLPDPAVEGNAGSFFMNPIVSREKFNQLLALYPQMPHYYIDEQHEKIPAGWMIDQCGWKGRTLGRAGVHDKQALVLVNRGGAAGSDIVALCEAIRSDVLARFGIDIHPEVNIV